MASIISTKTSGGGGIAVTGDTSGVLQLQSANGTTAVTIDASQNVGINATDMTSSGKNAKLAVVGNINLDDDNFVAWGGGTGRPTFAGNKASNYMYWSISGTESMRIDASGNVLVNQTTVDGEIGTTPTKNAYSFNTVDGFRISCTGTNYFNRANDGDIMKFRRNGVDRGFISVNSTSTTYSTSSDYRLKENILPMVGTLETVAQLKPVTYTWKADGSNGQGFIAHELQAIVPDAVVGEKDAVDAEGNPVYQGIDTSFLVATLTAAIQEQQAIITDLKARLEVLEGASA